MFTFSEEEKARLEEIIRRYPIRRAALLHVLWFVQERDGFISLDAMKAVAEMIGVSPAFVYGVVSFYTMFNQERVGRHHIRVCTGISCALRGGDRILEHLKKRLGIDVGETTSDGNFTLSTAECLGSCGTAPVMMVNGEYYENLTEEKVDRLLEGFKRSD